MQDATGLGDVIDGGGDVTGGDVNAGDVDSGRGASPARDDAGVDEAGGVGGRAEGISLVGRAVEDAPPDDAPAISDTEGFSG